MHFFHVKILYKQVLQICPSCLSIVTSFDFRIARLHNCKLSANTILYCACRRAQISGDTGIPAFMSVFGCGLSEHLYFCIFVFLRVVTLVIRLCCWFFFQSRKSILDFRQFFLIIVILLISIPTLMSAFGCGISQHWFFCIFVILSFCIFMMVTLEFLLWCLHLAVEPTFLACQLKPTTSIQVS